MALLTYSYAPMVGGKSLAALVRHHHVGARGLTGLLIVMQPREKVRQNCRKADAARVRSVVGRSVVSRKLTLTSMSTD